MPEDKTEDEIFAESWDEAFDENDSPSQEMCQSCGNNFETDSEGNQYCPHCDVESSDTDDNAAAEEEVDESEATESQEESASDSEESWKLEAEQWKQKFKSFEGRYRKEKDSLQSQIDELKAENEKLKNQSTTAGQEEPSSTKSGDSSKTDQEVQEFTEQFPDLAQPITTLIEKKAQELVDQRVGQVKEEIGPVKEKVESQAQQEHFRRISEAHPDWQSLVNDGYLQQWIDEQPTFMKERANQVVESGSTEEVLELLDTYKKAQETQPKSEDTAKRKQKAQDASAVRRHSPKPKSQKIDANDFDGAWEDAAGTKA